MKNEQDKSDFLAEQLPMTRKDVFFDCLKQRFTVFLRCGLLLALFLLPFFASVFICDLFGSSISVMDISNEEKLSRVASVQFYFDLINVPCLVIASIGFAGVGKILRQLVWAEPVFFGYDFKDGVKNNYKTYITGFAAAGVAIFLCDFVKNQLLGSSSVLVYVPWVAFVALFIPTLLFALSQSLVYKQSVFGYFKTGFSLYIRTALKTVLFAAILFLPVALVFIPDLFIRAGAYVIFTIFFVPFLMTIWFLFSCSVFDDLINATNFPQLVRKGMFTVNGDGLDQ